jgi:murein DD-endopeptidase MepM/ murein hydrolase activator NlpD
MSERARPVHGIPGQPRTWGNGVYVDLALGQSHEHAGHTVRLLSMRGDRCIVEVDGYKAELIVARRQLPTVVNGLRLFMADNRVVADLTTDRNRPRLHGALTRDALLNLSDAAAPLLDPARYIFPISRQDGYVWSMEENSHMYAYLRDWRSHEGVDMDLHAARGRALHPLVAIEDGVVRWIDTMNTRPQQACLLLESASQPGIWYAYQHLNRERLLVSTGARVSRGQPLAFIWGDQQWGHLHFAVHGYGEMPANYGEVYRHELPCFPYLYELWHGTTQPMGRQWRSGRWTFDRHRASNGNRKSLNAYDPAVGYGWVLGAWNPAGKVERLPEVDWGTNARLRRTLFAGTPAQATNPHDYYAFRIDVPDGVYEVQACVGDSLAPTWQTVTVQGIDAGTYALPANRYAWTPVTRVTVTDQKLVIRIHLRDETRAGLAELIVIREGERSLEAGLAL